MYHTQLQACLVYISTVVIKHVLIYALPALPTASFAVNLSWQFSVAATTKSDQLVKQLQHFLAFICTSASTFCYSKLVSKREKY